VTSHEGKGGEYKKRKVRLRFAGLLGGDRRDGSGPTLIFFAKRGFRGESEGKSVAKETVEGISEANGRGKSRGKWKNIF